MFKIGEFSRLAQVPVPTLRYYDQVGLLKPVKVDTFSGYRYYAASQLPRLHRILALKGLGFTLEQIARRPGRRSIAAADARYAPPAPCPDQPAVDEMQNHLLDVEVALAADRTRSTIAGS